MKDLISSLIFKREQSALVVESAYDNHDGEGVLGKVYERLSPGLPEGATMPDVGQLLQLVVTMLSTAREKMVAADRRHRGELDDDAKYRSRRDDVNEAARDMISAVRDALRGGYGDPAVKEVGLAGRLPTLPKDVQHLGVNLSERLLDPSLKLPEARLPNAHDPVQLAESLKSKLDELGRVLGELRRETRESQQTQIEKDTSVEEFNEAFLIAARFLELVFLMAGETRLAELVRPSVSRPGLTANQAGDDKEEPSSEVPADTPAPPPPAADPASPPDPPGAASQDG